MMDRSKSNDPFDDLLPQHKELIESSGISEHVARARGYKSVTTKAELKSLGFSEGQRRVPALLIPIHGVQTDLVNYQIRPDAPRIIQGKAVKYETIKGSKMAIDVPPQARDALRDPGQPLFITEGARKADAGVSVGLCTIAMLGVWNWRGTNEFGGKAVLPDWDFIPLNERLVYLVFDSDAITKKEVHVALSRLKGILESRKASVFIIYLPPGASGEKVGLDDFLANGGTRDQLLALAVPELRELPVTDDSEPPRFVVSPEGKTLYLKPGLNSGEVFPQVLADFVAIITTEIAEDDGQDRKRIFRIEATVNRRVHTLDVPADRFEGMKWAMEELGAAAVVRSGNSSKDRFREAIQILSPQPIPAQTVYRHTGWTEVDGDSVYLHAGGAIGPQGEVPGIEVRLDDALQNFHLPPPPVGEELREAVDASLGLLNGLTSDEIMFPLFSIIYRGVLNSVDFGVHLSGTTGTGKSELAALIQRHFGADMDKDHLPANWSSTANWVEALAYYTMHSLLVVDDYNPIGSRNDIARFQRDADRLFRALGNQAGRGRMRQDASLRKTMWPRGVILSTGEDIPTGHSCRARLVIIETPRGCLRLGDLTEHQERADLYSHALAAYLQWMAQRRPQLIEEVKGWEKEERRRLQRTLQHGRTGTSGAALISGLRIFTMFAQDVGVMTAEEAAAMQSRGQSAIQVIMERQAQYLQESKPEELFLQLLASSLSSGAAHLCDSRTGEVPQRGSVPDEPLARIVGWRMREMVGGAPGEWRPGGTLIGWVDADAGSVYLNPRAALSAVQKLGEATGSNIALGSRGLWKALYEAGILSQTDSDRHTKKVRLAGTARSVLHLTVGGVFGESGTTGTTGTDPAPAPEPVPVVPDVPANQEGVPSQEKKEAHTLSLLKGQDPTEAPEIVIPPDVENGDENGDGKEEGWGGVQCRNS